MNDLLLGGIWIAILVAGLSACVVFYTFGLASTYVRDLLHVGAGIWVLGWPWWHGGAVATAIVVGVALATMAMPWLAHHNRLARHLVHSVTNGDEHWVGLIHYTIAYAALSAVGLASAPFPAAAALLSLSLGDGIGGAIGRDLGRHHYRVPGGKQKSLEGSIAVAVAATAGVLIAALVFGQPLSLPLACMLGAIAAVAEACAPRSTDNLIVPASVWIAATLAT